MKFAALVVLNRLRQCRELAVRVVDNTSQRGAVVDVLDLSKPLPREAIPVRLVILPGTADRGYRAWAVTA